ncbi:MAG: acetate/propionate family kinase [Magnetococcus sp. DMHC-1]|nr:acetate/propionate family kinase [Magnetococcales bacterium]
MPTILVINAGSSSLKFTVFANDRDEPRRTLYGQIERITTRPRFAAHGPEGTLARDLDLGEQRIGHEACLGFLLDWLKSHTTLDAAGHRVVHGGIHFRQPVRITPDILQELATLTPLAPLHQPHNLAAIRALERIYPGLPQVACFDTAFHANKPPVAAIFPLPRELTASGIRRYGFHGLSYEYIARVLPRVAPEIARGRVVVAHLGSGASMCAMRDGCGIETTMGLSTVDGLIMGTRCGSIDPGVIMFLAQERGLSLDEIREILYNRSGLLGVSGLSNDMRELLNSSDPNAILAVDLFIYRIRQQIGSLAASLEGIDGLVFTAGIGEHAPLIRQRLITASAWLGMQIDPVANAAGGPRLTTPESPVSAWMIPTNEEMMIAIHTRDTLSETKQS